MKWKQTLVYALWTAVPVIAAIWHFGPGNRFAQRDLALQQLARAQAAAQSEDWHSASRSLVNSIALWPEEDIDPLRRTAFEAAKSQIRAGDLIGGQDLLMQLVDSLEQQPAEDASLLPSVRHELGMSSYYAAWMMRLEGATTEEWMTEAENARQQFRLLAEECTDRLSQNYTAASENVEAVIRLEQMDLSTLMARPLPKNCCSNCNNLCQNKRKQAQGKRNQGESKSQKKGEDAREKIKKSNNAGIYGNNGTGS